MYFDRQAGREERREFLLLLLLLSFEEQSFWRAMGQVERGFVYVSVEVVVVIVVVARPKTVLEWVIVFAILVVTG